MKYELFFFILFATNYFSLKYINNCHLDTRASSRVNGFITILLTINLIVGVLALCGAAIVMCSIGKEGEYSIRYLTLMGVFCFINSWYMWKRWNKIRNTSHFFDITNELKFK